ncbi:MAG: hypothetical protein WEC58_00050, partial [Candidatus Paceibacterota bacterium]
MDTVIIKIYGPGKFKIGYKQRFLPEIVRREYTELSDTEKQSNRHYLRRFVLKAPAQDTYLPKVDVLETLDKERKEVLYVLIAEFSLPKLLYGNSLQEVSDKNLGEALTVLQKSLSSVGIIVEANVIANARVSGVHFCKNVILPRDIRLQDILAELQQVDINKTVDITTKENKNGGQVLHIYSGTVERVFYDKIADAMRPKVKRKDKGKIVGERSIVEKYGLENQEVFRFEYRIKKTQAVQRDINAVLDRKPKTYVAFRDLFSDNLSKTILLKSWHTLVQRPENQLALIGPTDDFKLLLHIAEEARKKGEVHSMNRAFISYG